MQHNHARLVPARGSAAEQEQQHAAVHGAVAFCTSVRLRALKSIMRPPWPSRLLSVDAPWPENCPGFATSGSIWSPGVIGTSCGREARVDRVSMCLMNTLMHVRWEFLIASRSRQSSPPLRCAALAGKVLRGRGPPHRQDSAVGAHGPYCCDRVHFL